MAYEIRFDRVAEEEMRRFRKFDAAAILDQIDRYLRHQPDQEQGSRIKSLEQPAISQFRLRVGDFRVYYDVEEDPPEVRIIRIVRKGKLTTEEATRHENI